MIEWLVENSGNIGNYNRSMINMYLLGSYYEFNNNDSFENYINIWKNLW